jgi:hypothetical protein
VEEVHELAILTMADERSKETTILVAEERRDVVMDLEEHGEGIVTRRGIARSWARDQIGSAMSKIGCEMSTLEQPERDRGAGRSDVYVDVLLVTKTADNVNKALFGILARALIGRRVRSEGKFSDGFHKKVKARFSHGR